MVADPPRGDHLERLGALCTHRPEVQVHDAFREADFGLQKAPPRREPRSTVLSVRWPRAITDTDQGGGFNIETLFFVKYQVLRHQNRC
jgi:hypothetical protein